MANKATCASLLLIPRLERFFSCIIFLCFFFFFNLRCFLLSSSPSSTSFAVKKQKCVATERCAFQWVYLIMSRAQVIETNEKRINVSPRTNKFKSFHFFSFLALSLCRSLLHKWHVHSSGTKKCWYKFTRVSMVDGSVYARMMECEYGRTHNKWSMCVPVTEPSKWIFDVKRMQMGMKIGGDNDNNNYCNFSVNTNSLAIPIRAHATRENISTECICVLRPCKENYIFIHFVCSTQRVDV